MSPYDKIPALVTPNFTQSTEEIALEYQDAYFEIREAYANEAYRSERWKMAAIIGWMVVVVVVVAIGVVVNHG